MVSPSSESQDLLNQTQELENAVGYPAGAIIGFEVGEESQALSFLADQIGIQRIARSSDYANDAIDITQASHEAEVIIFDRLGVAVLSLEPDRLQQILRLSLAGGGIEVIEVEPTFSACNFKAHKELAIYLEGYRDAVNHLYNKLSSAFTPESSTEAPLSGRQKLFTDSAKHTWGLQATGVAQSTWSGRNVKVAVLDTGLDLKHPDFSKRAIVVQSFVPGQEVQDGNGHGTHCAGIACGFSDNSGLRYGVACEAELFIGKVLSNHGSSLGRSTIAGIEWALSQGCQIISLSLGEAIGPNQGYSQVFERIGRRALLQNCLIVAAAGNESNRQQGVIAPVGNPANCPSILAVSAIDCRLEVADFSNGGINPICGRVDIAAPGVDIYSSTPEPTLSPEWLSLYDRTNGTSMATPYVAGIAALLCQSDSALTADQIWRLLISTSTPLPFSARDVGAGMIRI